MAIIEIRKLTTEPQDISEYADFLLDILLKEDAGVIETDYKRRQNDSKSDNADWVLTSHLTGEKKIVLRLLFVRLWLTLDFVF